MLKVNKEEIIPVLTGTRNIRFAYLFGSVARQKERFGSDLDLAVYFEKEPQLLDIGKLINELENVTNCKIDLISLNDLYKKNPGLAFSVIEDGILLFCNDEKLLIHFKKKVFLHYLDFKPVIDLFNKKLNERIQNKKFAVIEK
jgi:predicted nucleotidyltransferase